MTPWEKFCLYAGPVGIGVGIAMVVEAIRTDLYALIARGLLIAGVGVYFFATGLRAKRQL